MVDVIISAFTPPRFPKRCVVCGEDEPRSHASLITRVVDSNLPRGAIATYSVEVPCCFACGLRLHAARAGYVILLLTSLVAGWIAYAALYDRVGVMMARFAAGAVTIALVAATGTINQWYSPGFDFVAYRTTVTFSFRDLGLAYEFKAINAPDAPALQKPSK